MNFRRALPILKAVAACALVLTAIISTASIAGADSVGNSPPASGGSVSGSGHCTTGTGGSCTITCTSNGGATTAYTYANPFPWCGWDSSQSVDLDGGGTPSPGHASTADFCATGFYAWDFYGTVSDPTYYQDEVRVPINDDCPTTVEKAWVMSPSPLDANVGDTAALEPLKWASGPLAGQQQTEAPYSGATLWDLKGEPTPSSTSSVLYSPDTVLSSSGVSGCSSLETNNMATNIGNIASGYTAGTAADVTTANEIWAIYKNYVNNFPNKVASPDGPATYVNANIKVDLPEYYPPVTSESGLLSALAANYNKAGSYGAVFPCASVLQYAELTTTPKADHRVIGSCVIAINEQEKGVAADSYGYGTAPVALGGTPMGGNRVVTTGEFASTTASATDLYSAAEAPDPDITSAQYSAVFSDWRSAIATKVGSETYDATAIKDNMDYPFIGPSYNVGTNPPNAETNNTNPSTPAAIAQAASQAKSHALCTIDTPPPTITPAPSTPTTTTTKPSATTTTTAAPTTPTTIDGPAGITPFQTMTAFIPVFADGGSLRPQYFEASLSAFSTAQCVYSNLCHVSYISVSAKITGTNGYTECATQTSTNCDFYVIPPSTPTPAPTITNSAQGPFKWNIEFFEPTKGAQRIDITLSAAGRYIDYHKGITGYGPSIKEPVSGSTAKTCAANGGTFSGGSCYKLVRGAPIYGPIANSAIPYPLYAPGVQSRVVTGALPES